MKKIISLIIFVLIIAAIAFGILFFLKKDAGKGALQVTSSPESEVYLDGSFIGKTSFCACDSDKMLSVGEHAVKLEPVGTGFSAFEEKISINKGTLTALDKKFANDGSGEVTVVSLMPLVEKNSVEIFVVSVPDKANVFLDSNPVGITPLLLKKVSESDHSLRISKEGYRDKTVKVKTAMGHKLKTLVYLGIKTDLFTQEASVSATPAASPSSTVTILDTPTGFLRVREKGSINSLEIGRVKPGESYPLINETDDWFEIQISSSEADLGWISSDYAVKK